MFLLKSNCMRITSRDFVDAIGFDLVINNQAKKEKA